MLFIHSYFEIEDRNVKSGRFLKCGINVSHCVGRYKICNMLVFIRNIPAQLLSVCFSDIEFSNTIKIVAEARFQRLCRGNHRHRKWGGEECLTTPGKSGRNPTPKSVGSNFILPRPVALSKSTVVNIL